MNGVVICSVLYLIILIPAIISSFVKVEESSVGVVERLGKFHKIIEPGSGFIIPVFDKLTIIDMSEQKLSLSFQSIKTKDNAIISIDLDIFYQVIEPHIANQNKDNLQSTLKTLVLHTLMNFFENITLQKAIRSYNKTAQQYQKLINKSLSKSGLKANLINIKNITANNP